MSFFGGRLLRAWRRSRIRLPRRPPAPEELRKGDRIQIESAVWRIGGLLLLLSDDWAFLLEPVSGLPAGTPNARLIAPGGRPGPWTLIRDGQRFEVPVGCLVIYPAAEVSGRGSPGGRRGTCASAGGNWNTDVARTDTDLQGQGVLS